LMILNVMWCVANLCDDWQCPASESVGFKIRISCLSGPGNHTRSKLDHCSVNFVLSAVTRGWPMCCGAFGGQTLTWTLIECHELFSSAVQPNLECSALSRTCLGV
jgi:hypothetical protein